MACVVAGTIDLASDSKFRASQEAAADGDFATAADDARAARAIQPWAAGPRLQLALIEEPSDVAAANRSINEAIERSNEDWRIWLVATRLRNQGGRRGGRSRGSPPHPGAHSALAGADPRAGRHRQALKHPPRTGAGLASVSRPPIQEERRPDR